MLFDQNPENGLSVAYAPLSYHGTVIAQATGKSRSLAGRRPTRTSVKARFSRYLEQCAEGPVVVTKNGRPTVVLLAVTDEEELERLVLAHTPRFMALLDAARERIKKSGGMKHEDFWRAASKNKLESRVPLHQFA